MSYQARQALNIFSSVMTSFCRMEPVQLRTLIETLPHSAYQPILSQRVLNQNLEEAALPLASCYGTIPKDEFIKTLKRVSLVLMKPIYRDLQDPLLVDKRHELMGRLVDAITELEFPVTYPADARLLQAVGETDPQKFAQLVQPLALSYLQREMAERLVAKDVTEIPEVHNFSDDPDLGSLNYIFSQVAGEQQDVFRYLGIALDMTGCAYEDPKLLQPLFSHSYT
jgi:hypothetical protein